VQFSGFTFGKSIIFDFRHVFAPFEGYP
jgi:hypothetical protein